MLAGGGLNGAGFEGERVEAGVGLGDAEAGAPFAGDQLGEHFFSLRGRGEFGDGLGRVDVGVDGLCACHAGAASVMLLEIERRRRLIQN